LVVVKITLTMHGHMNVKKKNVASAELSQSDSGGKRDFPNFGFQSDTELHCSFVYLKTSHCTNTNFSVINYSLLIYLNIFIYIF
jgi:hypothetical protein